jgi:DoxX
MKPGKRVEHNGVVRRLTTMIEQAVGIIRWIAQPSLAQLMLRLALAVPFWKSGILKWNGFLQLNDTAIYLFTDEFKLHLPGGPYDFPAPTVMAFLSGCGDRLSGAPCAWLRDALCRIRSAVHDLHRRAYRARRLADPYHVGGDGARDHGLGSVLTEDTVEAFAEANKFRRLPDDNVATNPAVRFRSRPSSPRRVFSHANPISPVSNGAIRTATSKASCC